MKFRRMIGLGIVGIVSLFLLGSYVSYSNHIEALESRGSYGIVLEGSVYLTLGIVQPIVSSFKASFDSSPEIPGYMEYLSDRFSIGGGGPAQGVSDNETFVIVHITVTVSGADGFGSTLLDEDLRIAYLWAGGLFDSGKIGVFSYSLGPYVAYHEFSPYKVTATVQADKAKIVTTEYLTIPDISEDGI